jgi:hypothetical protein
MAGKPGSARREPLELSLRGDPAQGALFRCVVTLTSGISRQSALDPFLSLATGIFSLTKSALYSINWRELAELPCVTIAIDEIGKSPLPAIPL